MAETGTTDDIDSAVAKALADALVEARQDTSRLTKGARVRRHAEAIRALKAQRWSWEQIAKKLTDGGLQVSARTLRLEMAKLPSGTGQAASGSRPVAALPARGGEVKRRTAAQRAAPPGKDVAKNPAASEEPPGSKATADGFFDAEGVEN